MQPRLILESVVFDGEQPCGGAWPVYPHPLDEKLQLGLPQRAAFENVITGVHLLDQRQLDPVPMFAEGRHQAGYQSERRPIPFRPRHA